MCAGFQNLYGLLLLHLSVSLFVASMKLSPNLGSLH
jgi:hypothetical protein